MLATPSNLPLKRENGPALGSGATQMKRREFVAGVCAAASWPIVVRAQKPIPVIAFLNSGAAEASASKALMSLTEAGLLENGLVQCQPLNRRHERGGRIVCHGQWYGAERQRLYSDRRQTDICGGTDK